MQRFAELAAARLRDSFTGTAPALPLALARIALGSLVLVRTTDVLRGVIPFNHHTWMRGVEYAPYVDRAELPALVSPLLPGFSLGVAGTWSLVVVRTASALFLILGVRPRIAAGLLAASGFWLMAADRYRYLHHLYLLWTMAACFALVPSGARLSLERALCRKSGEERVPRWSLQVLRLLAASVYFASGAAKLRASWLSGEVLRDLEHLTHIGGPVFRWGVDALGYSAMAWAVCLTELCLGPLLLVPRTRRAAVAAGALLHAGVVATMEVSTFSGQMLLLLALFLIRDRPAAEPLTPPRQASPRRAAAP